MWLGLGMIAAGLAYFALTWDDGDRPLLAASGVAVAVTDLGILLLPMQRIVARARRERFFLAWGFQGPRVPAQRRGRVRPRCVCGASRRTASSRTEWAVIGARAAPCAPAGGHGWRASWRGSRR